MKTTKAIRLCLPGLNVPAPVRRPLVTAGLLLLVGWGALGAAPSEPAGLERVQREAREYLALDPTAAARHAEGLAPAQAAALLSQVRQLARARNPDVDRLAYLVAHLERQRAIALAQKRLDNLLWVIGLTIALFAGFVGYVMISQRRALLRLEQLLSTDGQSAAPTARPEVFRG